MKTPQVYILAAFIFMSMSVKATAQDYPYEILIDDFEGVTFDQLDDTKWMKDSWWNGEETANDQGAIFRMLNIESGALQFEADQSALASAQVLDTYPGLRTQPMVPGDLKFQANVGVEISGETETYWSGVARLRLDFAGDSSNHIEVGIQEGQSESCDGCSYRKAYLKKRVSGQSVDIAGNYSDGKEFNLDLDAITISGDATLLSVTTEDGILTARLGDTEIGQVMIWDGKYSAVVGASMRATAGGITSFKASIDNVGLYTPSEPPPNNPPVGINTTVDAPTGSAQISLLARDEDGDAIKGFYGGVPRRGSAEWNSFDWNDPAWGTLSYNAGSGDTAISCVDQIDFRPGDYELYAEEEATITINLPHADEYSKICLHKGWNLIATSGQAESIQSLFPQEVTSILTPRASVWESYSNNAEGTLETMTPYRGHWIYSSKRVEVELTTSENQESSANYSEVEEGWNLLSASDNSSLESLCSTIRSASGKACLRALSRGSDQNWQHYDFERSVGNIATLRHRDGVWVKLGVGSSIDSDGDGISDEMDAFPHDATETMDSDSDGIGDNADAFPLDATETIDSDSDGVGNNADAFPQDASETTDSNNNGIGDNAEQTISGTVSAPGGSFAFNPPSSIQRLLASLLGENAHAAISGLSGVGSGVDVELVEIDANGDQVGDAIATAVTSGESRYTLNVPVGHTAAARYAIIAKGRQQEKIKSMWSANSVDIDPGSHATLDALVESTDDLSKLDTEEIISVRDSIESFVKDLSESQKTTASGYKAALKKSAQLDEETDNIIKNKSAAGKVCGVVMDPNGTALNGVNIFAMDYNTKKKRAQTRSRIIAGEGGKYCFNAPLNAELIVGAVNRSMVSFAATEYYTSASPEGGSGTKCHQMFCGDKVTVTDNTLANFKLVLGTRITGSVKGDSGMGLVDLPYVKVMIRDGMTLRPVAATLSRPDSDGMARYIINVVPSNYTVYFRNVTRQPYGSISYTSNANYSDTAESSTDGGNVDRNFAEVLDVTEAGATVTANGLLPAGEMIQGTVCQGDCTDDGLNTVGGSYIVIDQTKDIAGNAPASDSWNMDSGLSRVDGTYRMQVPYGTYQVTTRGKKYDNDGQGYTLSPTSGAQTIDLEHIAHTVSIRLTADGTTGIQNATVILEETSSKDRSPTVTRSDGTALLDVPAGNYHFFAKVSDGQPFGSCNWDGNSCSPAVGKDSIQGASAGVLAVTADDTTTLSNLTAPAGVQVAGIVKDIHGEPLPNASIGVEVFDNSGWRGYFYTRTGGAGRYSLSLPTGQRYQLRGKFYDEAGGFTNDLQIKYKGPNGEGCILSEDMTVNFDATGLSESQFLYTCP